MPLTRSGLVLVAICVAACGAAPIPPSASVIPTRYELPSSSVPIPGTPIPIPPTPAPTPLVTRAPGADAALTLTRIAIGACLLRPEGAEALADIADLRPELMLWLGDNVYADRLAIAGDIEGLRSLYRRLGRNERFQRLDATTEFMATWDDHDYGANDAGAEWPAKREAQAAFFDFWGIPPDDPARRQPGVYSARIFGTGDQTVQVILLDGRFNRDPYGDDPRLTMLGDVQWAWLEQQLAEPARIRIIGSGIQVANDYDPPTGDQWESWGDLPHEQARLFALIRERRIPGVVLVSGDMHHAELTRLPDDAAGFGYPTYDLTASGMDQDEVDIWPNPGRIGEVFNEPRKFGLIGIDWATDPVIRLEIHGGDPSAVRIRHEVRLSELTPS